MISAISSTAAVKIALMVAKAVIGTLVKAGVAPTVAHIITTATGTLVFIKYGAIIIAVSIAIGAVTYTVKTIKAHQA